MSFGPNDNLCHCGTIKDAILVAEQLFVETHAMNCPAWTLQIAVALRTICARSIVVETGLSVEQVKGLAQEISDVTIAHMAAPEELLRRSHEKKEA